MKAFLFAALFTLGFGSQAWASTPAELEQNLVTGETMDGLVAEARQEIQLAHRGDRHRGGYSDYGYRDHGYRHGRHPGYYDYGYYPRHRHYYRERYYGPRYWGRRHHRHYRW